MMKKVFSAAAALIFIVAVNSMSCRTPGQEMRNDDAAFDKGKTEKSGKILLALIPGGNFKMGSEQCPRGPGLDAYMDEKPLHDVRVDTFYMSRYMVTQKQYRDIMGESPDCWAGDDLPVVNVNWYQAVEFCNRLSELHGRRPYYKINKKLRDRGNMSAEDSFRFSVSAAGGSGFRLPTEAEWEYACRAGTTTVYYWGDEIDGDYCWYRGNSGRGVPEDLYSQLSLEEFMQMDFSAHPVGEKEPNGFGLYDMSGNVFQWCWDWYDGDYYSVSPVENPAGPGHGRYRVMRGGDWGNSAHNLRSASRHRAHPGNSSCNFGFRIAASCR